MKINYGSKEEVESTLFLLLNQVFPNPCHFQINQKIPPEVETSQIRYRERMVGGCERGGGWRGMYPPLAQNGLGRQGGSTSANLDKALVSVSE